MFDTVRFSKPGGRSEGRGNKSRQHRSPHRRLLCEMLETRALLSSLSAFVQQPKLTASDGAASADFGSAVAVSGTTMVVGAYSATIGANTRQGAAYVFTEPASGWVNMTQTAKLTASDGLAADQFGLSVAISGTTVVVGAYTATVGGNSQQGAAYVFTEPGSSWTDMTETAKLTASDGAANDLFGSSVSISGNTVVVGAYWATVGGNFRQGAAYVFTEPSGGWTDMTQAAKLTSSDGHGGINGGNGDVFGRSVAIDGNTVVVGASNAWGGNIDQGAAYVFESASGVWTQTQKLTASDGAANDLFGLSVSISGNTVVVGARGATVGGNSAQGAAYVFGPAPLGLSQTSIPPDTVNVAYNQTIAAVGGTGTVTLKVSNISGAIKGLTLPSSGTGSLTISGTPTAAGTETFTVKATDPAGDTASANYSITVNPALTLSPTTLPAGTVNVAYGYQEITASGGTSGFAGTLYSASVTNAIPGVTAYPSSTSIQISGTPTATGTETITATVTDAVGAKTTMNYFLTVTGPSAITSSNWSGYAVATGAGAVTDVKGSWIEPSLNSPSAANTYSAFWVGIDGYSSGTVEQIGTDLDTNASGKAVYYAWYEMYPSSPVDLSMTIHPGDTLSGEVKYSGSNKFTLTLTDVTTNTTFSTSQTLKSAKMSSAEWIAEAPSSSRGVLPLADFGAVSFSGASATLSGTTGPIDNPAWPSGNPISITMVGSSGTEAYPSSIVDTSASGTSAFSVSFAAAQNAGTMVSQGANGLQQKPAQAAAYLQCEAQSPFQQPDSQRSLAIRAIDLVLTEF